MNRFRVAWLMALFCALMLSAPGCNKAEDKAPESSSTNTDEKTSPQGLKTVSASETLTKIAGHLPGDTFVIGMIDVKSFLAPISMLASQGVPDLSLAAGTPMRKEMEAFLKERLGADPFGLEWIMVAGGASGWAAVIVGGDLSLAGDLKSEEVDGLKFQTLKEGNLQVAQIEPKLYLIVPEASMIPKIAAVKKDPATALTKNGARMDQLKGLLDGVPGGMITVAVQLEENPLAPMLLKDAPPQLQGVKAAAISIGSAIRAEVRATPETIQGISDFVDMGIKTITKELKEPKSKLDTLNTVEGAMAIYTYHLADAIPKLLTMKFDGDKATVVVDFAMDDTPGAAFGAFVVSYIGIMAAIAVHAFMGYIEDSKSAEAQENLKTLGQGALLYFHETRPDPSGSGTISNQFRITPQPVCTSTGGTSPDKAMPKAADYARGTVFYDLKFEIFSPHYFKYCYHSADGKSFNITAEGQMDSMGPPTRFKVEGNVDSSGVPVVGSVMEVF